MEVTFTMTNFFDLPAEIRNIIYENVFSAIKVNWLGTRKYGPSSLAPSILFVSSKYRDEIKSALIQHAVHVADTYASLMRLTVLKGLTRLQIRLPMADVRAEAITPEDHLSRSMETKTNVDVERIKYEIRRFKTLLEISILTHSATEMLPDLESLVDIETFTGALEPPTAGATGPRARLFIKERSQVEHSVEKSIVSLPEDVREWYTAMVCNGAVEVDGRRFLTMVVVVQRVRWGPPNFAIQVCKMSAYRQLALTIHYRTLTHRSCYMVR